MILCYVFCKDLSRKYQTKLLVRFIFARVKVPRRRLKQNHLRRMSFTKSKRWLSQFCSCSNSYETMDRYEAKNTTEPTAVKAWLYIFPPSVIALSCGMQQLTKSKATRRLQHHNQFSGHSTGQSHPTIMKLPANVWTQRRQSLEN